jgi:3-oxoacyl-(acyl-carrier-protein) synthase
VRIGGEVKNFDPLPFVVKKDVKKIDGFIQLAIAASQFAVDDAKWQTTPENADQTGVFIASGIGGFSTIQSEHIELLNGGPRRVSPFFIPASIINLATGHVSIRFVPFVPFCSVSRSQGHYAVEGLSIQFVMTSSNSARTSASFRPVRAGA